MMELGELEEVKNEAVSMDENSNDHQALIDEVELFLTRHETSSAMPTVDLPPEVNKLSTISIQATRVHVLKIISCF